MTRFASLFAVLLSLPSAVFAQDMGAAWLRTRTLANALNPKISLIADFVAQSGPTRGTSGFSLRETELALQSEVDPYARYDIFLAKPDGENLEVEEGYVTLLALPGKFQLRAGKFRPSFGRLNIVHRHELAQVDAPLVLSRFLGGEGMRSAGAEASRIFAPFGVFTELSYAFLQDLGEKESEPVTTTVTDTSGNVVNVRVQRDEAAAPRRVRDYAHAARARVYHDLTESANLELGLSGASHQPKERLHRQYAALDMTFRWKPAREGLYHSFIWRSEALYSKRNLPAELDPLSGAFVAGPRRADRRGAYTYAEWQADRRWRFGARGDYAEDPALANSRGVVRALSPYATFSLSEFNRFRLQYSKRWVAARRKDDRVLFQWTVVLGPHGAHPF